MDYSINVNSVRLIISGSIGSQSGGKLFRKGINGNTTIRLAVILIAFTTI